MTPVDMLTKIIRKISHIPQHYKEWQKRERCLSYGDDHADKTFYVIGFNYDTQGLFAIVKSVLSHVMYAIDKGWIPVVDLQNYTSQYQTADVNAWELFFEQPCGYNLHDISNAKNVVRSYYGMYPYDKFVFHVDILGNLERFSPIAEAYRKYIRPQKNLLERMHTIKTHLQIDDKTLGILCRGTDYLQRQPHHHPRQPQPIQVIRDAQTFIKKHGYTKVFVATEDAIVLQQFKDEFGDTLRYIDQPRIALNNDQQYLSEVSTTVDTRRQMALDYYTALYILSQCPSIIAGRTAGTLGAALMSEGYEHAQYYDLGCYE